MTRWNLVLAMMLLVTAPVAAAESDAEFYKGKTIRFIMSTGVAGGYAAYARTFAAHLPDHVTGSPGIIVESMPGAGGLLASNYLFFQAATDGTVIGLVHGTIPLAPLFGTAGARFDSRKFGWLGSMDGSEGFCLAWGTSPIKTWNDMLTKTYIVGSSGIGSQMDVFAGMLNKLYGTKIKVISGYKDGNDIFLATQSGEVQGLCGGLLTTIGALHPDWLTEKKFAVPIVVADHRMAQFPDTPAILEFTHDDQTRQVLGLLFATEKMDRPLLAPPNLPPARLAQLRAAFEATMRDSAFLAALDKQRLSHDWIDGPALARLIDDAYGRPAAVIASAKELFGSSGGN